MSDEKTGPEYSSSEPRAATPQFVDRPHGWIYKGYRIGKKEFWYASPKIQLLMVSIVCFLCPGMFNALGGLGGGGTLDASANSNANTALYSTFAFVGFFAGTFANRLGLRLTLSLGGVGYCIYGASFLCYAHTENHGFVIFAGAFLGVCAGLLWTAQGSIMMAYPPEESKGRYISWFWIIFNAGGVIGSLIPLAENVNNKTGPVTDGTYAAFIILMFAGAIVALFLVDANKVIREDNTKVILMKNPTWSSEFRGLYETITLDPWIVLLFPMFFASNIFYTYQNNGVNAAHFNTRARALNDLLYWLAQIVGAVISGYALDFPGIRRSLKAKISFGWLVFLTVGVWGGGYAWQRQQPTRAVTMTDAYKADHLLDWADGGDFLAPMFLYFFYGMYDAFWQTSIYWYMGALSNSGRKAANYAGFYKGIQSAGAAIFWSLDGDLTEYSTLFYSTWGVMIGSLLIAGPLIILRIQDHVSIEQDLKFSDETVDDVVVGPDTKRVSSEA
jgi:MFS family permease